MINLFLAQVPRFRKYSKIFFLTFLVVFFLTNDGSAEETLFKLTPVTLAKGAPIQISSDTALYDENQGFAIFKGDVRVGHGPYQIRGKHLKVVFDVTVKGKKEPLELVFIDGIIFSNGFEMGKSQKANYNIANGLIILREDVMFKQKESVFFGQTAEFDLNSNNMSFKGRINASISTND